MNYAYTDSVGSWAYYLYKQIVYMSAEYTRIKESAIFTISTF